MEKSDANEEQEAVLIAFINGRSGGQVGPKVKRKLTKLLGEEHVFDLVEGGPEPGSVFCTTLPSGLDR